MAESKTTLIEDSIYYCVLSLIPMIVLLFILVPLILSLRLTPLATVQTPARSMTLA